MAEHTVNIAKSLHSNFAVSTEDGEKIFETIDKNFKKQDKVTLDFADIGIIVSTFLNAAIGQLYGIYETEFIQKNLSVKNMSNQDLATLKTVTDRAKEYFKDKRGFDRIFKKNFPDATDE